MQKKDPRIRGDSGDLERAQKFQGFQATCPSLSVTMSTSMTLSRMIL